MVDKITSPIGANELIEKTNEIIDNLGGGGISALDDLSDVSITSAASGQLLQYDGTDWVNGTISSSDIETALGYTPYDSSNPSGYISSASLTALTDVTISNAQDGQSLVYDSTSGKWINSTSGSPSWGSISGTLSDQTDLQNALDAKQSTSTAVTHTASTAVGSASKPVYIASNGVATTIGYTIETSVPAGAVFTDTKNSAGSSDSSAKLFVVGATAQASETQTFSNDAVFIDTSGQLNSTNPGANENSTVVATTKWVVDKGYKTTVTSSDVTTALGYTPYDSSNPSGFISSIPIADTNQLGGVKVGANLSIDANGVLSANTQSITVDTTLSTTSTNPAQNKAITNAINGKSTVTLVDWTV